MRVRHWIALARERTAVAGVPLRDRYGYAASDETVNLLLDLIAQNPDDEEAVTWIGAANLTGDLQIAMAYDTPTDEEYELQIVQALRSVVEEQRDHAARTLPDPTEDPA